MATAFCIFGLGDITCQMLFERRKEWDKMRTLRQSFVIGCIINPSTQLYMINVAPLINLNRVLTKSKVKMTGSSLHVGCENVLKACSQFILIGPPQLSVICFLFGFLKELEVQDGIDYWQLKFIQTFQLGMCFWPCANFIAYHFFPFHKRQPVLDSMAFMYSIALSYLVNSKRRAL